MIKVKEHAGGVICYVAKLNRSNAALPQALLNDKGTVRRVFAATMLPDYIPFFILTPFRLLLRCRILLS